jgi:hypothetical protein
MKISEGRKMNKDINVLAPHNCSIDKFLNEKELRKPFSSIALKFVDCFSKTILKEDSLKRYPDLVSLGFWMRQSNIKKLESEFKEKQQISKRLIVKAPVGTVIHFAPSNVDTIFIYSLFLSFLLGNKNIVRVSSKPSEQRDILVNLINRILDQPEFSVIKNDICIVNYLHSKEISGYLSQKADLRVIWGGDDTVKEISSIPLLATANEIKFANKYSIALIDSNSLSGLNPAEFELLITNFVNDSFWFSQQGCSSPRSVYWLNSLDNLNEIEKFWEAIAAKAKKLFPDLIIAADIVNKIVASNMMVANHEGYKIISNTEMLTRVKGLGGKVHNDFREHHCGNGLFIEEYISSICDLIEIIDRKTQTITYFGISIEKLQNEFTLNSIFPDRVVPLGKSLDFSTVWDGYDLLESMTRNITFE